MPRWMRTALAVPMLALSLLTTSAEAAAPPRPALSGQDKADIQRIETYLNRLHSLSARFLQVNEDGGLLRGDFFMERPGKMRFQYDPPATITMVSDGSLVLYYDREVKQSSYVPLSSTPLAIL